MKPIRIKTVQKNPSKKYIPPKGINPEHQEFFTLIGMKLKGIREKQRISASKLAREVGVSRNGYHQMECGRIYFNIHTLIQVLDYYKIPTKEFLKDF